MSMSLKCLVPEPGATNCLQERLAIAEACGGGQGNRGIVGGDDWDAVFCPLLDPDAGAGAADTSGTGGDASSFFLQLKSDSMNRLRNTTEDTPIHLPLCVFIFTSSGRESYYRRTSSQSSHSIQRPLFKVASARHSLTRYLLT